MTHVGISFRRKGAQQPLEDDAVGHWCARFSAETFDRLEIVEDCYRKALVRASETGLNHDERYRNFVNLVGIKLAVGIDSVTVYRSAYQSTTSIELFRCSIPGTVDTR